MGQVTHGFLRLYHGPGNAAGWCHADKHPRGMVRLEEDGSRGIYQLGNLQQQIVFQLLSVLRPIYRAYLYPADPHASVWYIGFVSEYGNDLCIYDIDKTDLVTTLQSCYKFSITNVRNTDFGKLRFSEIKFFDSNLIPININNNIKAALKTDAPRPVISV